MQLSYRHSRHAAAAVDLVIGEKVVTCGLLSFFSHLTLVNSSFFSLVQSSLSRRNASLELAVSTASTPYKKYEVQRAHAVRLALLHFRLQIHCGSGLQGLGFNTYCPPQMKLIDWEGENDFDFKFVWCVFFHLIGGFFFH